MIIKIESDDDWEVCSVRVDQFHRACETERQIIAEIGASGWAPISGLQRLFDGQA